MLSSCCTRSGSGSIMASRRSKLSSLSIPSLSGSNVGFSKSKPSMHETHLKVSHNFNTQWLRANLGASLIHIGHSASLWVSKECGNLWSSPTILAASTRTSSCLSCSPTLARMTRLYPDREAGLYDHAGQRRCQQDRGSESGPHHREEVDHQN